MEMKTLEHYAVAKLEQQENTIEELTRDVARWEDCYETLFEEFQEFKQKIREQARWSDAGYYTFSIWETDDGFDFFDKEFFDIRERDEGKQRKAI